MKPILPLRDILNLPFYRLQPSWENLSRRCRILNQDLYDKMKSSSKKSRLVVGMFFLFMTLGSCGVITSIVRRDETARAASVEPQEACISSFSTWMAESLVARQQGMMTNTVNAAQTLQAGITQKALNAVLDRYPRHDLIRDHLHRSIDSAAAYLSDAETDVHTWALDRLSNGNAMLRNGSAVYQEAIQALVRSITLNQRSSEQGLWYWQAYPQWSYLDGMYSFAPFSAMYQYCPGGDGGLQPVGEGACVPDGDRMNDIVLQFTLLWEQCRNATTGLLHHGYDASRRATWAGHATGSSPVVWGRSLGWFLMALVDTLELLPDPPAAAWRAPLLGYYRELASSVMRAVDGTTGGWFQVVDQGARAGNYIESSATAMFAYALLKGARLGYIDEGDVHAAQNISRRAHEYLSDTFLVPEADGILGWNGTVGVCSLNSSATYEYYIGQPIDYNSPFGIGAYILASVEVEILEDSTSDGNDTGCPESYNV